MSGIANGLIYVGSLFKDDIAAGAGGTLVVNHAAVGDAGSDARGPDLYLLWVGLVWTGGAPTTATMQIKQNSAIADHDTDWLAAETQSAVTRLWTPPASSPDYQTLIRIGDTIEIIIVGQASRTPHIEARYGIGVH